MSGSDLLRSDRLRAAPGSVTIGSEIMVVEETGSTNDFIRELAADDRPEGLVVFAEHQTAGRGQRGNRWESARYKGLWFSILLRPGIAVKDSPLLTVWAAEAVATTIESRCSCLTTIKRPNDIYVNGRKIGGVLVEMRARPRTAHLAILGIGVNVNQTVEDFPPELRKSATSLAIVTQQLHDRNELAIALLRNLDQSYRAIRS